MSLLQTCGNRLVLLILTMSTRARVGLVTWKVADKGCRLEGIPVNDPCGSQGRLVKLLGLKEVKCLARRNVRLAVIANLQWLLPNSGLLRSDLEGCWGARNHHAFLVTGVPALLICFLSLFGDLVDRRTLVFGGWYPRGSFLRWGVFVLDGCGFALLCDVIGLQVARSRLVWVANIASSCIRCRSCHLGRGVN